MGADRVAQTVAETAPLVANVIGLAGWLVGALALASRTVWQKRATE